MNSLQRDSAELRKRIQWNPGSQLLAARCDVRHNNHFNLIIVFIRSWEVRIEGIYMHNYRFSGVFRLFKPSCKHHAPISVIWKKKGLYLIVRNPINTPAQYSLYSLQVYGLTKISWVCLFFFLISARKSWKFGFVQIWQVVPPRLWAARRGGDKLYAQRNEEHEHVAFVWWKGKPKQEGLSRGNFYVMYLERSPTIWLNHGNHLLITSAKYYYYYY